MIHVSKTDRYEEAAFFWKRILNLRKEFIETKILVRSFKNCIF